MSFSSEIKEKLSKLNNLANKENVKYELIGYLISNNTNCIKNKVKYTTANQYNINRFSKLLSNLGIIDFEISVSGKKYIIEVAKKHLDEKIEEIEFKDGKIYLKLINIEKEENSKALIRGIFLGAGSVNNPEKKYHLEIILNTEENMQIIKKIIEKIEINMKTLERKNGYSLYLKDGEEISNFLAYIGANASVLEFEEIRVLRDVKNNINRKVNCETANINKTVSAAVKQIEAIKILKKKGEFESLPDNLKEIAQLRLENPDATLVELGKMLSNPIGKSGVNHRLNTILKLNSNKNDSRK